jgi:hypothetical protein
VTVDERSLALVAWFDGWGQSQGMPPATFPRELDDRELAEWQDGWDEGKAATAAWDARCAEPLPDVTQVRAAFAADPPDGFVVTRNGTRWACSTCQVVGLPDGRWMEHHRRPHHACPDCGRQLTAKNDGSARLHTRCPRRRTA